MKFHTISRILLFLGCLPYVTFSQLSLQEGIAANGFVCDYSYQCPDDPLTICDEPSDEYGLIVPHDGCLRISGTLTREYYNNTNCSGTILGTITLKVRNQSGTNLHTSSTTGPYQWDICCVTSGDSFNIVIDGTYGSYTLQFDILEEPDQTNDQEPNNSMPEATLVVENTEMEGHIGYGYYSRDISDFYKFAASEDGSIQIPFTLEERGYLYLKNHVGSNLLSYNVPAGGTTDTLIWECVEPGDTFWIQINYYSGICGGYVWKWEMSGLLSYDYDPEPNDAFPDAVPVAENTEEEGHIGYGQYSRDIRDYYKISTSEDGSLQIVFTMAVRGFVYLKNQNGANLVAYNVPAGGITDSIHWDCVMPGDSFWIQVQYYSGLCGGYSLRWEMVDQPPFDYDTEPNNTLSQSVLLPVETEDEGHIGYGQYSRDVNDYFKLAATEDGTVQVSFTMQERGYIRLKNRLGTNLVTYNVPAGGVTDTISLSRVAIGDSFHIHVSYYSTYCGGYTLRWEMVDQPPFDYDTEPNNAHGQALILPEDHSAEGHIGYGRYSNDANDYYKLGLPEDGTLQLIFHFNVRAYLRLKNKLQTNLITYNIPPGGITDTIIWKGGAKSDSFWIQVAAYSGLGGGYTLEYHIIDLPAYGYDPEPNNIVAQAIRIPMGASRQGHIGYGQYGRDANDYYKFGADKNGNIQLLYAVEDKATIYLKHKNGYTNLMTDAIPIGGESDTMMIPCATIGDSFYIQIHYATGFAGGYVFLPTFESTGLDDFDPEPNNNSGEATAAADSTLRYGIVGHGYYQNDPVDWFHLDMNGIGGIMVKAFSLMDVPFHVRQNNSLLLTQIVPYAITEFDVASIDAAGDIYLEIEEDMHCTPYVFYYFVCYDANENGDVPDTIYAPPDVLQRDHIGYDYGSPAGQDATDVYCLSTSIGDTIYFRIEAYTDLSLSLVDQNGNVVFDTVGQGLLTFTYINVSSSQLCMVISIETDPAPYQFVYSNSRCQDQLFLSGFITGASYNAEQLITADGLILFGNNVQLKAHNMLFSEGFEVKVGSSLETILEGCENDP